MDLSRRAFENALARIFHSGIDFWKERREGLKKMEVESFLLTRLVCGIPQFSFCAVFEHTSGSQASVR
jgi:hypothetical protein